MRLGTSLTSGGCSHFLPAIRPRTGERVLKRSMLAAASLVCSQKAAPNECDQDLAGGRLAATPTRSLGQLVVRISTTTAHQGDRKVEPTTFLGFLVRRNAGPTGQEASWPYTCPRRRVASTW